MGSNDQLKELNARDIGENYINLRISSTINLVDGKH